MLQIWQGEEEKGQEGQEVEVQLKSAMLQLSHPPTYRQSCPGRITNKLAAGKILELHNFGRALNGELKVETNSWNKYRLLWTYTGLFKEDLKHKQTSRHLLQKSKLGQGLNSSRTGIYRSKAHKNMHN